MATMALSEEQEERLRMLMDVFLEENRMLNLSAYRKPEMCWAGNVLDSAAASDVLRRGRVLPARGGTVADIGTGGGFPLLPLAILLPDVRFTGMDAARKKVAAAQRIVVRLQLKNVRLVAGRAEELGRDDRYRERFDVVLGRAVAPLATLLELMSPFARVGGSLVCWKSLHIGEELRSSVRACRQLHCKLVGTYRYSLDEMVGLPAVAGGRACLRHEGPPSPRPYRHGRARLRRATSCGGWGERQLLIYGKTAALPGKFPRAAGVPKKRPL